MRHPREILMAAARGGTAAAPALPRGLVDLLQRWHNSGLWPAERWLEADAPRQPVPRFDLFGPEPSWLFASGLEPDPALSNATADACPPWRGLAPLPWPAACVLAGISPASPLPQSRLWVLSAPAGVLSWSEGARPGDGVINLHWPAVGEIPAWMERLRTMAVVLDPDPERVGLLQLFGVPALHRPLQPVVCPPGARRHLLLRAQLRLGLPDPSWMLGERKHLLDLAVLGSTGPERERRWGRLGLSPRADGLLLLPRLSRLILQDLEDVQALQAWLHRLADCCRCVLQLEPAALGACRLPERPHLLEPPQARPAEEELLREWEERCH